MRSCLGATEGRFCSLVVPPPSPDTALAASPNDGLRQTGPCFARVGHRRTTRVSTDLVSFPSIPTSPPFRRPSDRRQSPKVWHPKKSPSTCSAASLSSARARRAAALIEGARRRADRDSLSPPDRYHARGAVAGCVRLQQSGDDGRAGCSVTDGAVCRGALRGLATRPERRDVLAGIEHRAGCS
jgi:hypothetical protein